MNKILATIALIGISLNAIVAQELVKDIYPNTYSSNPEALVQVGDKLFFTADSPNIGDELWMSDGTQTGTVLVKDIQSGANSGVNTEEILELNGKAIFSADNGTQGEELWISDGTEAGTMMIKEIHGSPTAANGSYPRFLTKMGDEIFFNASDKHSGVFNEELWKTDGTAAGTVMVKEINPSTRSRPEYLTEMNGKIYFSADDGTGKALWASDGTEAGTVKIKSNSSGASFSPSYMIKMGDEIFFGAYDSSNNNELWKSDGTTAGTVLVKDIAPGAAASSDPAEFTVVGNKLYFIINGGDLWVSNGTSSGTQEVSSSFNNVYAKISFKDALYFVGRENTYGKEIYTVGASGTPQLVKDIWVNGSSGVSNEPHFEIHGSKLFFAATETGDYTLWQTDGTTAGTIAVPNAPTNLTRPEELFSLGNILFFAGDDNFPGGTGTELWAFKNLSSTTITENACPSFDFEGTTYTQSGDYMFTYTNTLGYDSTLTLKLTICGNVAISELNAFEVNAFPNPVNDVLNINTTEKLSKISLLNLNGQTIKSFDPSLKTFNFSDVSTGVYFIELTGFEKKSIMKIIKR